MTHDEQTMYMFALRYSLGRQTYAFGLVTGLILDKYECFNSWQLKQMASEIRDQVEMERSFPRGLAQWELDEYTVVAAKLERFSREVEEHERRKKDINRAKGLQPHKASENGKGDVSSPAVLEICKGE